MATTLSRATAALELHLQAVGEIVNQRPVLRSVAEDQCRKLLKVVTWQDVEEALAGGKLAVLVRSFMASDNAPASVAELATTTGYRRSTINHHLINCRLFEKLGKGEWHIAPEVFEMLEEQEVGGE